MKDFNHFIDKKNNITYILKKAFKWDFYSLNFNNYPHKALSYLNNNKNIQIIQTSFNIEEIVRNKYNFENTICGYFNKKECIVDNLFYTLSENIEQRKTILLITDLINYSVDTYNYNEYCHHSTCIIFHPTLNISYNLFYINSHGNAILLYNYYDLKLSSHRTKHLTFEIPLNLLIIQKFYNSFQNYLNLYSTNIKIKYNNTKTHNYFGPNLQAGDGHGICFCFPLIIIIKILQMFENKTNVELFEQKQLIQFVSFCFLDINHKLMICKPRRDPYLKKKYININEVLKLYNSFAKSTKLLYSEIRDIIYFENIIAKKETLLIKKISDSVISFLTQNSIKNDILKVFKSSIK